MRYLYIFVLFLVVVSCKTATELLDNGNYEDAFDKALSELEKGNNVAQNTDVIIKSSNFIAANAIDLADDKKSNSNVKNWIKSQGNLYEVLENIGRANIVLDGLINEPYDALCSRKKDVDYKIVDHYFEEGTQSLKSFEASGFKSDSRSAYYSLEDCEKYGGSDFFPSLVEKKEYAYQNGIVYYTTNHLNIGSGLFLKPLPNNVDFDPDCKINVNHDFVSFTTEETVKEDKQTSKIEDGQEEVVDSTGVNYIPKYKYVKASVLTKTITVTASVTTNVWSESVTENCNVSSRNFTTQSVDSYEEISVEGDERALTFPIISKGGEPAFFRSNLKDEVIKKADKAIGI